MVIKVDLKKGTLCIEGNERELEVSCEVRSRKNGRRLSHEVVRTIPDGAPYDPLPFPAGIWHITGVQWATDYGFDTTTYGPVKILTDAWQMVKTWKLDEEGDYEKENRESVADTCYWLHYTPSKSTLGCIRIIGKNAAIWLGKRIEPVLAMGGKVVLEVAA